MSSIPGQLRSSKASASESRSVQANPTVRSKIRNGDTRRVGVRKPARKAAETVIVAVNASKEITTYALEWALTNIVQPGDRINLLALLPGEKGGRKLWNLPRLAGDCANGLKKGPNNGSRQELEEEVNDSCSCMMQQLHNLCEAKKVQVSLKVVPAAVTGVTATEAQRVGATWVILDSQLKKEEKYCMEQFSCNLVKVKRSSSKILRLNLKGSLCRERKLSVDVSHTELDAFTNVEYCASERETSLSSDKSTSSSPELGTPFSVTDGGTSSASSSEAAISSHTSSEPRTYSHLAPKCADLKSREANAEAAAVSEADSTSDSCIVDCVSDSNSEDSCPMHRTTAACPDHVSRGMTGLGRSFDLLSQPWVESRMAPAQRDSFFVEPWKRLPRTRPSSANATPKLSCRQGRASTPASPLNLSKRFPGSGRLSFSTREGGSVRSITGSHPVNPSIVSLKNGVCSYRHLQSDWNNQSRHSYDLNKGGCLKRAMTTKDLLEKFSKWDPEDGVEHGQNIAKLGVLDRTSSVRKAMSLSRHVPPGPPPLCSICQHKAPVFGKPPRRFSYSELELATGGFSQANFLAEGGFGSVHRGVLLDGQAVAVKQHKLASSQGDIEFCSEVEVLSCAQHRNVVMLIGYCIEDKRRLLVYEFICNGSLDSHLYGRGDKDALEWPARQKIAVGAARGLRYLHEECRVGCIVHRDLRPNNILLTHDFEPMVGDFGLARWQPDGDLGVQTRVIGTFGYLAPEYAQSGQITEKADVYSFGVVLLELVTGRKAVDISRPKGQQCLTEWARSRLNLHDTQDLIDPRLQGNYCDYEVSCMLHAASLCISKDFQLRPRMSQVLRILEGDIIIDTSGSSTPYSGKLACEPAGYGSRSSRISGEYVINRLGTLSPPAISYSGSLASESLVGHSCKKVTHAEPVVRHCRKLSYEALKAAYKDRRNSCRLSYEDVCWG
eukprot:c28549_g1_i1 orf=592-3441(+)